MFVFIIFMISCENVEPEKTIGRTFTRHGNFEYIHHQKNGGLLPNGGDTVVFHYCLRNDQTVISCTQKRQKPLSLTLPPRDAIINPPKPLYEGLKMMSAGDSITIFYPLPKDEEKPNGFKDADFVIYDIKVLEIKKQKG